MATDGTFLKRVGFVVTGYRGSLGGALRRISAESGASFVGIGRDVLLLRPPNSPDRELEQDYHSGADIKDKVIRFLRNNCVEKAYFINAAWSGVDGLAGGGIATQMQNVPVSNFYANLACEIGAIRFVQVGSYHELENSTNLFRDDVWPPPSHRIYALAKSAASDITAYTCYSRRLDHLNARFSMAIPDEISNNTKGYVPKAFLDIINGREADAPVSQNLYSIASYNEIARQLISVAIKGGNCRSFLLGTGESATLSDYIFTFKEIFNSLKMGKPMSVSLISNSDRNFSIKNLLTLASYECRESFSSLARTIISKSKR